MPGKGGSITCVTLNGVNAITPLCAGTYVPEFYMAYPATPRIVQKSWVNFRSVTILKGIQK